MYKKVLLVLLEEDLAAQIEVCLIKWRWCSVNHYKDEAQSALYRFQQAVKEAEKEE